MLLPMCHWFVALQHIFYDNYFVSTDCFIKNYSKITRARGQNKHKVSEGTGGDLRVFLVRSALLPQSQYLLMEEMLVFNLASILKKNV